MKRINRIGIAVSVLTVLALLPTARAAVHASMELQHRSYLRFEDIRALITIRNDTDEPFIIDGVGTSGESQLFFEVRYGDQIVRPRDGEPYLGRLLVLPDEKQEIVVDLCDAYPMSREGRYFVKVIASQSGEAWESRAAMIDIVPGLPLASTERVVPGYRERLRRFSLRYWTREGHEYLFLTVDETKQGYNYGVFELGKLIRVRKPAIRVDRKGRINVWHQTGSDRFLLTVLQSRPDGVTLVKQTDHQEDGSPYSSGPEEIVLPPPEKPKARWWQFWRWFGKEPAAPAEPMAPVE